MLGRLGQFDGVVGNAIMLPLWSQQTTVVLLGIRQISGGEFCKQCHSSPRRTLGLNGLRQRDKNKKTKKSVSVY